MKFAACWSSVLAVALCGAPAAVSASDPLDFDVNVILSPKAAAKLQATHEGISASASYYGDPTPAAARHADAVGHINLGNELVTLPGGTGPIHFTGRNVAADRLGWIEGGMKVNVNVYSARRSNPDNILACDFIDGSLAAVVEAQPITLRCGLIAENPETGSKP